ncbi:hypothetical protein [Candidatus Poriferisodalis sp.]|uniref:hypothetical protein n=1 Tax=Candidatus Poriferisodalis sp. TaxID=3101277 RepID=UPI003B016463
MSGVPPWPDPVEAFLPAVGATPFLGEDLIPYLVLALGAALLVGNVAAMARPRRAGENGETVRAPAWRAVPLALVGLVASIWALATLVAG